MYPEPGQEHKGPNSQSCHIVLTRLAMPCLPSLVPRLHCEVKEMVACFEFVQ